MNGMKYLVFRYQGTTIEFLYLFPEREKHADFAARQGPLLEPIRGGFCRLMDGKYYLYGEAFSLGLHGDKEKDTALFLKQIAPGE